MSTRVFSVAWDYRCPFARIACAHVVEGLRAGADWDVTFTPHSLKQDHVADDEPPVWERPESDSGLLALEAGIAVRDTEPERFPAVHLALFDARHVEGLDLRERHIVLDVLGRQGVDVDGVVDHLDSREAFETVRKEHEAFVASHQVWGVPTFIAGDRAVFVRLMDEPSDDPSESQQAVERILDLLTEWPELNEFKHTTRDR
jgi:DSBA-like thioredoxin domain